MVATLTKNGTGCSIGDARAFDAWGNILSGAGSGDPKGRYCANLGHKQDDESGLTYMRARYYEATSGRFISEDPAKKGANWYCYACDDPIGKVDASGKDGEDVGGLFAILWSIFGGDVVGGAAGGSLSLAALLKIFKNARAATESMMERDAIEVEVIDVEYAVLNSAETEAAEASLAGRDVDAASAYAGELEGELLTMDFNAGSCDTEFGDGGGPFCLPGQ